MISQLAYLFVFTALALPGTSTPGESSWALGTDAYMKEDFDAAATHFQAFVDGHPKKYVGHLLLGQSLLHLGRPREALPYLLEAEALSPGKYGVLLALGEVYIEIGEYRKAIRVLRGIDEVPLTFAARSSYHAMLARAYEESGDGKLAKEESEEAAWAESRSRGPENPGDHYYHAKGGMRAGRMFTGAAQEDAFERAAESARLAVVYDPSYWNLMLLGEAQLATHDYQRAIRTLTEAAKLAPNEWQPWYFQAEAYMQLGRLEDANKMARKAFEKSVFPRDQAEVRGLLDLVESEIEKTKNANGSESL